MSILVRMIAIGCSALLAIGPAAANPQGGQVVGGAATIQSQGNLTTITQTTSSAIINWNTFNIGAGEITKFVQPSASAVALNRVTGGLGPSQIYGTITANGRVFLVNPDGILFGAGAVINTAGFLATTNDIKNSDFMAGKYNFNIPGKPDASVVNLGTITAADTGIVALVAPGVRNAGVITANLGTVALSAGNAFTLDFYGDKLITLQVGDAVATQVKDVATGQTLDALVKNDGTLRANGGKVHLTAAAARQIVDSVVNNKGVIEANAVGVKNGEIVLGAATAATKGSAPKQTVKIAGTLSAAGKNAGEKGGKIQVTGEDIWLTSAKLDASGAAGGGKVLIGGDVGGSKGNAAVAGIAQAKLEGSVVPTASWVNIDAASRIDASATLAGDGGKVVVWSDQVTSFAGLIAATGGASSGNGGFAEVSGKNLLNFAGLANLSAPTGTFGTLLLDPLDFYVTLVLGSAPTGASEMTNTQVQNQLAVGNMIVATNNASSQPGQNGDIFINAPVTWSSGSTLTLSAFRNIVLPDIGSTPNLKNTGAGNLVLRADSTGTGVGTVVMAASTFINRVDWSASSGKVSVYYNPSSYTSPTDFTSGNGRFLLASPSQLTAYMLVNSLANLQSIGTNGTTLGQNYALGKDIDATGFTPFGVGSRFSGQFDGSGGLGSNYTISNLSITINGSPVGLFGFIDAGASVKNLNLANVNINAGANLAFVGPLAGQNEGTIDNVHVLSGSVNGGAFTAIGAGGLVGQNTGTIANSSSAAAVTVGDATSFSGMNMAGGLAASNSGSISNSSATGAVTAGSFAFAGGLVGQNAKFGSGNTFLSGPVIDASFATGNVNSAGTNVFLGGLVGSNMPLALITNSRATGNVTATGTAPPDNGTDCFLTNSCAPVIAGGFAGQNFGTISGTSASFLNVNCVAGATCASGAVFVGSHGDAGGFVGNNYGTIEFAFATGAVTGAAGTTAFNEQFSNATDLGGFAGSNRGVINFAMASGNVGSAVDNLAAAGFVADNGGTISNSLASGNVTAGSNSAVGGFAASNSTDTGFCNSCFTGDGQNNAALITLSMATGNVVAADNSVAGGFSAFNGGTLLGVGAQGMVGVGHDSAAGGLVGVQDVDGTITAGIATGAVAGVGANSILGGLVAFNGGTIVGGGAFGNVIGTSDSYIGGLVGINLGIVTASLVDPLVGGTGANNLAGGIAGLNAHVIDLTSVEANIFSGNSSLVGGLAGLNITPTGTITNSTFTGTVTSGSGSMTSLPGLPAWIANCTDPLCGLAKGLTLPFDTNVSDNSTLLGPPVNQISLQQLIVNHNDQTPLNLTQPAGNPPANNPPGNGGPATTGSVGGKDPHPPVHPGPPQTSGPPPGLGIGRTLSEQMFSGAPPLNETRFLPSEIVLQISNSVSQDQIQAIAQQLGITLVAQQSVDATGRIIYRFRTADGRDIRDLIRNLEKQQIVASAQPNYVFTLSQAATPAAAGAEPEQPDLAQSDVAARTTTLPTGDSAQYVIDKLKLNSIHQRVRGRGILVAVIDSEIDIQHPDLRGGILAAFNATKSPSSPHTHGTGMAGAIASKARLLGVAPEVRILAIKAFDENATSAEATSFQILAGLDHAVAKGARIINMSFAGPRDLMVERALKNAYDKNIVLIAAAGNAGPKSPPLFPAADPNVIAVGAVDYADKPFVMANRGKHIAVVAPGVDVLVPAPKAGYQLTTGTSVAAAHVSGVVALLLEAKPNLTPRDVRAVLTRTAKPVLTKDKDHQTGAGLVDPILALQALVAPRTVENATQRTTVR